jgi:hypothetical protein
VNEIVEFQRPPLLDRLLLHNYMASLAELEAGYSLYREERKLWEERR